MNEQGKSDRPKVPGKSLNKATGAPGAAEEMEGRGLAKEKRCHRTGFMGHCAQCRKADLQHEAVSLRLALCASASDLRQEPGALGSARRDPRGGPPAGAVPTAIAAGNPARSWRGWGSWVMLVAGVWGVSLSACAVGLMGQREERKARHVG
jgi:hypothetical protein